MKKYEKNVENRKEIVSRISELTGQKSRYTRVPRCAYEIGPFTVEMDGTLVVEDNADQTIVETLIREKLIKTGSSPEALAPQENPLEAEPETAEPDTEEVNARIAFPLSQHSAGSLINLVCMVYSRGALLSKATGGKFYVSQELVDRLLDHPAFSKGRDVVEFLQSEEHPDQKLTGLSFEDEKLIFDGFGSAKDAEHLQTFMKLAAAMNKMAITQKRVQAKEVNDENEKYALRVWLIRLGLNGAEYKADRKNLMEHLTGHTAFRNDEDKARWIARQAAKREAIKAAKTADQPAENNV